jgi:hypothetical protein
MQQLASPLLGSWLGFGIPHQFIKVCAAAFAVFDLLRLNGDDLRLRPLEARREALVQLVDGVDRVLFSSALSGFAQIAPARPLFQLGWPWAWSRRRGRWLSLMTSKEAG